MLKVSKLKRAYGDFIAADAVDFSIAKGEIVGLLGHNGAGKTTVMKMLSGYLEPSAGQIYFEGKLLADHLKMLQQKIGYLPESLPVYPELSVAEYLDYAAELKGLRGFEKQQEIKRVVNATDIAAKLLGPIATLSRGYKQRVGVAQALLGKPRLLILDEPTNGLDPSGIIETRELIKALNKEQGKTILVSSHLLTEMEKMATHIGIIHKGALLFQGSMQELQRLQANKALITVEVSDAKKAAALLAEFPVQQVNGTQFSVSFESRERTAELNKALVQQGIDVYQVSVAQHDLENLFVQITNQ